MSCLKSALSNLGSLVVDVAYHVTCSYETSAMKSTLLISLSSSEHNWSSITHLKFWAFHPTSHIACASESRSLWTLWKKECGQRSPILMSHLNSLCSQWQTDGFGQCSLICRSCSFKSTAQSFGSYCLKLL